MNANPPAQQRPIAQGIASLGRGKDTMLVHMTPGEVQGLQKLAMAHGGSLTINPHTGLPEAGFLSAILPMVAGALLAPMTGGLSAALLVGGATGLATGSVKKGLMAGMGAFGGAGIGEGLAAAGASTVPAATTAAPSLTTPVANALPNAVTSAGAGTAANTGSQMLGSGLQNYSGQGIASQGLQAGMSPAQMATQAQNLMPPLSTATNSTVGAINATPAPGLVGPGLTQQSVFSPPAPGPTAAPVPTPPPSAASNMGRGIKNLATGQEGAWSKFYGQAGSPAGTVNGVAVPEVAKTGIGGGMGLLKSGTAATLPILAETNKPKPIPQEPPPDYYNTTYSPGERNPRFGEAGEPYYINQGYTPGAISKIANIAGGGLLAFSGKSGSYVPESATAARTLKGMYSGEDDSDKPVIPVFDKETPDFEGYATAPSLDKALDKLSDKQIAALAKKSKNPILRGAAASKDLASRGSGSGIYESDPEDYYKAASGGSIGYEEGGDVKPEDQQPRQNPFAMRQGQGSTQPAYQSPFAIQQNRPDPTENARYMTNLNKSLQGAPAQQYSAPSFTSQGVLPGDGTSSNGTPFPDVPAFAFNPSRPIAPVAPVAQPATQPVAQPSPGLPSIGQPAPQPPTQPTVQPTTPSYFPGFDEFKSTYTPPPPPPKGEIQQIHVNEDDSYFQDEAGQKFNRELVGQSGDDRNYEYTPVNYTPPEEAYQKLIDERMANPPVQQPTYTPPTYTPPTQPTSQPSDGGMVTDEYGNTYYEPAPPPPPPPPPPTADGTPTADVMPRSTDSDAPGTPIGGIASLVPPDSAPMGGDLRGMVQPSIPQPQTPPPPPPPPAPEVPTYQGNQVYTNEDGHQVYRDSEDGRERRVPDEHPSDRAGGPIKAKKYAMGGIATLPTYAAGGKLLNGDGDGMSDSIPAVINGPRPQRAALADGEFVIPADVVSHLGNGSTKAGAKRLYQMMDKVRMARVGTKKQGKQINPSKFMPA